MRGNGYLLGAAALAALALYPSARAADLPSLPAKAPAKPAAYDWSGFYFGGHFGYATGTSDWSATQTAAAAPPLSGALDFYSPYDGFKGVGSYFLGLQGGYNVMLPSRLVLGAEVDVSAPAFPAGIADVQTFSSAAAGQASYGETALQSGTARGRIGYEFDNNWLLYGTGGFAWTYDQLTRTQLAGTPVGGSAAPGDVESLFLWRLGWTAGAGLEVPIAPNWTAKLEYLYADYGRASVTFPTGAQRFDSDLVMQSVRLGLNYQLGIDPTKNDLLAKGIAPPDLDRFNLHGQTTFVEQYVAPFHAPYQGANSLASNIGRETWDVTFYAGLRLWEGAELWVDPEIDQGFGLSGSVGAAGFPSAEAFKVGFAYPYARLARMFVRQTIDLGGESEKVEAGINQFAGAQTADRLVITVGKLSPVDIFDANRYAHDARNDFLNWALGDTGTFDYAADAWAYTYGGAAEWYTGNWTVRGGVFDMSIAPNTTNLDASFGQFQLVGELERRYALWDQPGKVVVTGYLTRGRMGRFDDAVQLALETGQPADIAAVRQYTGRPGMAANMEQQIADGIGLFVRAGVVDGAVEPYEFTDIDRTAAGGFSFSGKLWGRDDDTLGVAGIVNGISSAHRAFLNAGGLGILVGDGMLPHYGPEQIIETYYSLPVFSWHVTFDYQFIDHPAYNADRGPASVFATRLHTQF